jgi:hypothetical protein
MWQLGIAFLIGALSACMTTYLVMRYKTAARDNFFLLEPLRRLRKAWVFPKGNNYFKTHNGMKILYDPLLSGKPKITIQMDPYEDLHLYFSRDNQVERVSLGAHGSDLRTKDAPPSAIQHRTPLRFADHLTAQQVKLCLRILQVVKAKCKASAAPAAVPAA